MTEKGVFPPHIRQRVKFLGRLNSSMNSEQGPTSRSGRGVPQHERLMSMARKRILKTSRERRLAMLIPPIETLLKSLDSQIPALRQVLSAPHVPEMERHLPPGTKGAGGRPGSKLDVQPRLAPDVKFSLSTHRNFRNTEVNTSTPASVRDSITSATFIFRRFVRTVSSLEDELRSLSYAVNSPQAGAVSDPVRFVSLLESISSRCGQSADILSEYRKSILTSAGFDEFFWTESAFEALISCAQQLDNTILLLRDLESAAQQRVHDPSLWTTDKRDSTLPTRPRMMTNKIYQKGLDLRSVLAQYGSRGAKRGTKLEGLLENMSRTFGDKTVHTNTESDVTYDQDLALLSKAPVLTKDRKIEHQRPAPVSTEKIIPQSFSVKELLSPLKDERSNSPAAQPDQHKFMRMVRNDMAHTRSRRDLANMLTSSRDLERENVENVVASPLAADRQGPVAGQHSVFPSRRNAPVPAPRRSLTPTTAAYIETAKKMRPGMSTAPGGSRRFQKRVPPVPARTNITRAGNRGWVSEEKQRAAEAAILAARKRIRMRRQAAEKHKQNEISELIMNQPTASHAMEISGFLRQNLIPRGNSRTRIHSRNQSRGSARFGQTSLTKKQQKRLERLVDPTLM